METASEGLLMDSSKEREANRSPQNFFLRVIRSGECVAPINRPAEDEIYSLWEIWPGDPQPEGS
jgi:hypothetical protein